LGVFLAAVILASAGMAAFAVHAADVFGPAYLSPKKPISAPAGFTGLCGKYGWVCATSKESRVAADSGLKLAARVNSAVNRQTRQVSDRSQYRKDEVWALPTASGGDCEDLALLKKRRLLLEGVPASALLIATVLDLRGSRHAVLVLRTDKGDLVLDSLNNRIRHWTKTGYTFLKLQNPKDPNSARRSDRACNELARHLVTRRRAIAIVETPSEVILPMVLFPTFVLVATIPVGIAV
jgi:predicted transglutaminase-like cysteine proteinase